jgi:hypothetical protein
MRTIPAVLHRIDSGILAAVGRERKVNMGLTSPRPIGRALLPAAHRSRRIHLKNARTHLRSSYERSRGFGQGIAYETTHAIGATCRHRSRHPRARGRGRVVANRAHASTRCTAAHAQSSLCSLNGAQHGWQHYANSTKLWKRSNGPPCERGPPCKPRVAGSGIMHACCRKRNPRFVRWSHTRITAAA